MYVSIYDDVNAIEIIRIQAREHVKNALFDWTYRCLTHWDSTVSFSLIFMLPASQFSELARAEAAEATKHSCKIMAASRGPTVPPAGDSAKISSWF